MTKDGTTLWDIRRSRNSDPQSSHDAAAETEASGLSSSQCDAVYEAVRSHPGSTSAELAVVMGIDRYVTARRLPDLEQQGRVTRGPIRPCRVSRTSTGKGRPAVTWFAKG